MCELLEVRRQYAGGELLLFRMLQTPLKRLRGLLWTKPDAAPVVLMGCSAIHTFGMRYRIDVAFVSRSGLVLEVWRSVPPGRLLSHRRAWATLERPHRRGSWLAKGEKLRITRCREVVQNAGGSKIDDGCPATGNEVRLCGNAGT